MSLLIFYALFSPQIGDAQSFQLKVDSIVHEYDTLGGYNGIVIVAFGPDSIFTFSYGYKNPVLKSDRITLTDRFDLASVAKQFSGLAALQLIDKGIIDAQDPIGKYIPELRPALRKVTVQQLANHTNGIHDFYSLTKRHDTVNREDALKMLYALDTTVFPAGSKWGYSNSGYLLLSEIVTTVTGMSFQNYCHHNIFNPLGMRTACHLPDCTTTLYGYTTDLKPITYNAFSSGEAGMYASGNDIIAYYQTVCRQPEIWRKYFSLAYNLSEPSNTQNWNYGFGWFFSEDSLGKFRAHSGRNWGAHSYIRWYDSTNTFVCLISNKSCDTYFKELREKICDLMVSEVYNTEYTR